MNILRTISLIIFLSNLLFAQTIRPIRDDIGFCWTEDDMSKLITELDKDELLAFEDLNRLIGGISPHDDYLYAGKVIYSLLKNINTKEAVIFGVTHGTVRRACDDPRNVVIFDEFDQWQGPYGSVSISPLREKLKNQLPPKKYIVSNKAHELEHSIEALIPFLQFYNKDIKITPIMVTVMDFNTMSEISDVITKVIREYLQENRLIFGRDLVVLISNDANHYGVDFENTYYGIDKKGHKNSTANDIRICKSYLDNKITSGTIESLRNEIWETEDTTKYTPLWCGRYPIIMGLTTLNSLVEQMSLGQLSSKLLKYSDTKSDGVLNIKNSNLGITAPVFQQTLGRIFFNVLLY